MPPINRMARIPASHSNGQQTAPSIMLPARLVRLRDLLGLLTPVAIDAVGRKAGASKGTPPDSGNTDMQCTPCSSYDELIESWQKAMQWTFGLDYALSVMLASITSTPTVGDQLWVKILGPAACGKSTLCEAVSISKEYIIAKSTIRGFHSGMRSEDGKDNSLVSMLPGMTLVTKDGDTLLQSPNLGQILAEARDLYDSTARTHYRNGSGLDYNNVRMTWILCGTSSLRQIDSSELGERFLDAVIMDRIDDELEDQILWRVANRAESNLAIEADNAPGGQQYEPALAHAMRLTGGYVAYLRENAAELATHVKMSDDMKRLCTRLGKFVAFMRARPSTKQDESAERELASRLVSQLVRLAICLAIALNRKEVDAEVMKRVRKVALDTSRGQTMVIAEHLFKFSDGLDPRTISVLAARPDEKVRTMLWFLRKIDMVELYEAPPVKGVKQKPKWRLTDKIRKLYYDVVVDGEQYPDSKFYQGE